MKFTHGELFAGIGGFSLGFGRAGIATSWAVEIDPACRRVLAHHHPDTAIHEDVRDVGAHNLEPVDIITFGSPCQDLSVAGNRRGFEGARSGLYFEAIRIIDELRPTYAVWENVPGAFSSAGGRDFHAALSALADIGAVDIAWAVLDAQWFGVAQRRRRVFVVADFRSERAAEILALSDGLRGDSPPSRTTGKDVAGTLTDCAGKRGWSTSVDHLNFIPMIAPVLTSNYGKQPDNSDTNAGPMLITCIQDAAMPREKKQNGIGIASDGPMYTLDQHGAHAVAFDLAQVTSSGNYSNPKPGDPCHPLTSAANQSIVEVPETVPTLVSNGDAHSGHRDEHGLIAFTNRGYESGTSAERLRAGSHGADAGDIAPTLRAMPHDTSHANGGGQVAVAFHTANSNMGGPIHKVDQAWTVEPHPSQTRHAVLDAQMSVRRLTPTECERLQGFPDGHTAIDGASDSTRYRQLGNAVAVPVAEYIGRQIVKVAG